MHQDDLMVAGDLVWRQGTRRVYAGPLASGDRAVMLCNFATPLGNQYPASNVTVFWGQVGLQPGQRCAVRDLFAGKAGGVCVRLRLRSGPGVGQEGSAAPVAGTTHPTHASAACAARHSATRPPSTPFFVHASPCL